MPNGTKLVSSFGNGNERLRLLTKTGDLERISFGLYALPDEFIDKMYITQHQRPQIIYSHETSLFLHELTDRDPIYYTVTLPTGYNATRLRNDGITVFTIKRELYEVGLTHMETMFGNIVSSYDMERTICDCIRSRNQMDIAIVTYAMKTSTQLKAMIRNLSKSANVEAEITLRNFMMELFLIGSARRLK